MNKSLPLFVSNYSIGKSILTCERADDIDENRPVSIFSIAQKHGLQDVYIKDANFSGFIEQYENAQDCEVNLRFGLQLMTCADTTDKSDGSRNTESKIVIWLKNSNGYKSLLKIGSKAATENFYYYPRISYKDLLEMWDDNLSLTIDFYDGFIAKNLLIYKARCIPNFGGIDPLFFIEEHDLPFDDIIKDATLRYCEENKYKILNSHTCYYYQEKDIKQYQIFRCIDNRTNFNKPNLSFFSSNQFAFETWSKKQ